jgi:hypothetical protein
MSCCWSDAADAEHHDSITYASFRHRVAIAWTSSTQCGSQTALKTVAALSLERRKICSILQAAVPTHNMKVEWAGMNHFTERMVSGCGREGERQTTMRELA